MGWTAEQESLQELWKTKSVDMNKSGVPRVSVANTTAGSSNPNILRTVYLPNEKVGQLRTENDKLEGAIQEQRAQFEKVVMQLRNEKGAFEETKRDTYLKNKQEADGALKENHDLEAFNQEIVKDHVDCLATFELDERRQQEELAQIRQENAAMRE